MNISLERTGFEGVRPTVKQLILGSCGVLVLIECAILVASGRIGQSVAAFALALLPIMVYLALTRPFLFPFALWAALVPFDNLLAVGGSGATVTRLLAIVCGAALLFAVLRRKRIVTPPRALFFWLLLAAWEGTSILWAVNQTDAIGTFGRIAQLVLLYAIVSVVPAEENDVKIVITAAVLGGVASALYGSWLFHHQSASIAAAQQQFSRLQIDFGDRGIDVNNFADALLFPAIAVLVGMLSWKNIFGRILCALCFAGCIVGINYSGSREAFVALGAGIAYMFVRLPGYRKPLALIGGIAAAASLLQPAIWLRFTAAFSTGGSGRLSIWRTALAAAKDHWLFGSGAGNFAHAYDAVYINVFQPYGAGWSRASHNIYLNALVELGAIGLIILGVALIAQFRSVNRVAAIEGPWRTYRVLVEASMIALVVASFFIDLVDYKYLWLLFCVMAMLRNAEPRRAPAPAISL